MITPSNYGGKNRREVFDYIKSELMKLDKVNILEIGSLRNPTDWQGHGCATLFFAWLTTIHKNCWFTTVDIDRKCIDNAVKEIAKFSSNKKVVFITGDALVIFSKPNAIDKLDCVYLDAWDYCPGANSAEKHLQLFNMLDQYIKVGGYLLIDDMYTPTCGKGELIIPKLLESKRYSMTIQGYMVAMKKVKD